jgi:hypothetical protein
MGKDEVTGMLQQSKSVRAVHSLVIVVLVNVMMESLDAVQPMVDSHGVPDARAIGELDDIFVLRELVHVRPGKADVDVPKNGLPFCVNLRAGRTEEVVESVGIGGPIRCVDGVELEPFGFVVDCITSRGCPRSASCYWEWRIYLQY